MSQFPEIKKELVRTGVGRKKLVVTAAAATTFKIPKQMGIAAMYIRNSVASSVTGGVKLGTTSGGTEVLVAQAVGASGFIKVADAALVLKIFSNTASTTLYLDAVTSFNSASLIVTIFLEQVDSAF